MLNFETSCTNRPLHNEHENVICAKKSFIEKNLLTILGLKTKLGQLEFFFKILSQSTKYNLS